jgi:hypothetical protein
MDVTTTSMRGFAADCLIWAAKAGDPSQRQLIVTQARQWAVTADSIDRYVSEKRGECLPDLRFKLN